MQYSPISGLDPSKINLKQKIQAAALPNVAPGLMSPAMSAPPTSEALRGITPPSTSAGKPSLSDQLDFHDYLIPMAKLARVENKDRVPVGGDAAYNAAKGTSTGTFEENSGVTPEDTPENPDIVSARQSAAGMATNIGAAENERTFAKNAVNKPLSTGRKIAGIAAGVGMGLATMNPLAGISFGSQIANADRNKEVQQHQEAAAGYEKEAEDYSKLSGLYGTNVERTAQLGTSRAAQAQAVNKTAELAQQAKKVLPVTFGTGKGGEKETGLVLETGGVGQTPTSLGPPEVSPDKNIPEPKLDSFTLKDGTPTLGKLMNDPTNPNKTRIMSPDGKDITDMVDTKARVLGESDTRYWIDLDRRAKLGDKQAIADLAAFKAKIAAAPAASFNLSNPQATPDRASFLADVAKERGIDAATKLAVGKNELEAMGNELARRGDNIFKSFADIQKVTGQEATFSNIHSNIAEVRKYLPSIKSDPTLVSLAMADPTSQLGIQLKGKIVNNQLNQEQLNLVASLRTLREDLFGIRQFFGNSPVRSDNQVKIMLSQLPDEAALASGRVEVSETALMQLERSISTIEEKFGNFSQLRRTGAGGGVETHVSMPDGSVHVYDATGKYIRTEK